MRNRTNDKHYNKREFVHLLEANGFHYKRTSGGHSIYSNGIHNIPVATKVSIGVSSRMIREHNLDVNV